MKAVFLLYYSSPPSDNLLSVHGEIQSVFLGGNGKATWLMVRADDRDGRYYSLTGKVWPGMANLRKGDIIDITAWEQPSSRRRAPFVIPEYWIWQMSKGVEIIINPDNVRALQEKDNE
ncbi:MAG: hypothetical protein AB1306_12280, partial [Nitrospirota bacterium]